MMAATVGLRRWIPSRWILGGGFLLGVVSGMAVAGLAMAQGTGVPDSTTPPAVAPVPARDVIAEAWTRALADPPPPYDPTPEDPDSVASGANEAEGVVRELPFGSLLKPWVKKEEPAPPWARPNTGASSAAAEKFAWNPVLPLGKRGSIDSGQAEYPAVLFVGEKAWMYYSAFGVRHRWEIAAAESHDGIHWTKVGAVLAPDTVRVVDAAGAPIAVWDSATVAFPCVLYAAEAPPAERFRMWYAGKSGGLYDGIGFATSGDGRNWTRQGRVMGAGGAGEWDAAQVVDPAVIPVEDGYRMYYCGSRDADGYFQVGLALSADGRSWVKYPENPIAKFGGNPSGVYTLDVLRDADGYTLFVSIPNAAREFEMFALRSVDGLTWDAGAGQMVLAPSRDGTWDDQMVYGMEAMELGDKVYLWFNGIYARSVPKGGEVGLARIGKGELRRLFGGP
jgi:predicted GH43/DUF377 family glycosyl hydrolase